MCERTYSEAEMGQWAKLVEDFWDRAYKAMDKRIKAGGQEKAKTPKAGRGRVKHCP